MDQIIVGLAGYFREHRVARNITIALAGLFLVVVISLGAFSLWPDEKSAFFGLDPLLFYFIFGFIPFVFFISALVGHPSSQLSFSSERELEPIRRERKEIRDRIRQKEPNIFDTMDLNLNELNEYYTINKSQARRSFHFSVGASVLGFITILAGIWSLIYPAKDVNQNITYITVIGGVLLQFIGGAYFYIYNKSLDQLNAFFGRLTIMQDTMLSIKLCDQISEAPIKTKILEELIFEIIRRNRSPPPSIQEKADRKTRKTTEQAREGKEVVLTPTSQTPRAT